MSVRWVIVIALYALSMSLSYIFVHWAFIWQSETGIIGRKENLGHLRKDYSLRSRINGATNSTFGPPSACHFTHAHYTADTRCSTGNKTQHYHLFSSSPLPLGLCISSNVKWLINDSVTFCAHCGVSFIFITCLVFSSRSQVLFPPHMLTRH